MRKGVSTTTRLSIIIVSIMLTIVLLAHQIGLVANPSRLRLEGRAKLCESIAIQFALAAQNNQDKIIRTAVPLLVQQNQDILSIAITNADGKHFVGTDNHEALWQTMPDQQSVATHVEIQLFKGDKQIGFVQICFRPMAFRGLYGSLDRPIVCLAVFLVIVGFPVYWLYLRRTFRYLDPSKVIPDRVKAILDTLSEGVLVLDKKEQIILANDAFIKAAGRSLYELQGRNAADFAWGQTQTSSNPTDFPWAMSVRTGESTKSSSLTLQTSSSEVRTFVVNSTPIRGTSGKIQGALVTFDDVSKIEEKNTKLEKALEMLNKSRNKIKQQNEKLKKLSMQDPLTGCLNRRAFFERIEAEWSGVLRHGYSLGYIMVDIDHFKKINDNHGHATGDQVLQRLSEILKTTVRKTDSVCRYGGEEFCVLLPHTDINNTYNAAEKLRHKIEVSMPANLSITASFGVSAHEPHTSSPQEMIDQADKALYAAKNSGRNRVIRWDQMPDNPEIDRYEHSSPQEPKKPEHLVSIPFSAVMALMSALEHRDVTTAVHGRRVAGLCVAMAKGLMSESDCFILEIAGLLHDIGKLGVPDSVLLKPGPLTDEEWKIMDTHDRMGAEIISASFGSSELTNIVRNSHAWYGGSSRDPGLPTGQDIPLRSRIVLLADAFDAMTSDRVYRKAMSQEEAFAELRRCAGKQFDPALVEHFIEAVLARDENRTITSVSDQQAKALRIGLDIERLACAMEARDISLLSAMAGRLADNATKIGLPEIAEVADNLKRSTTSDLDTTKLMEYTNELIELCRSHQSSYLTTSDKSLESQASDPSS